MAVGDWDRRELCPDGSCTGLIGPEGTCKVCGHVAPNWGDERKRGTLDDDADDDDADDDSDDADPIKPATRVEIGGGEWSARTLCPDGGCVGVIGADGKCKVCGKSAGAAAKVVADEGDDAELEDDEGDEADDYEDEDDEGEDEDEDEDDEGELAAAADALAGVASSAELASAKSLADVENADESDDDRKLCPDGACIGVIGPDGKCKVCGKEAAA